MFFDLFSFILFGRSGRETLFAFASLVGSDLDEFSHATRTQAHGLLPWLLRDIITEDDDGGWHSNWSCLVSLSVSLSPPPSLHSSNAIRRKQSFDCSSPLSKKQNGEYNFMTVGKKKKKRGLLSLSYISPPPFKSISRIIWSVCLWIDTTKRRNHHCHCRCRCRRWGMIQ